MQPFQKSVRNGIEDFLCPFTIMNITQGSNGALSHRGTMANDVAGSGGRDPYYAPCTCKCIKTYPDSGQVMWQSTNKVRFANGRIDYATFMTAHDDTMDAVAGKTVVSQGSQLGNMGSKGYATGIHCHIEIEQGSDTTWRKNEYGIWCFNNEVDTDDCYFVDNTQIINGMGGNWKYLKDVPVEEPKPVADKDKIKIEELEKELVQKEQKIKDLENENNDIREEIAKVKNQNKIYTTENEQLLTENVELKKKNKEMEEHIKEEPTLIFTSTRTDYYAIRLEEGQQLYLN